MPLLRQKPDGTWERLVVGSLSEGHPRYEPFPEWDNQAWEARQRAAQALRDALVLELPQAVMEFAV